MNLPKGNKSLTNGDGNIVKKSTGNRNDFSGPACPHGYLEEFEINFKMNEIVMSTCLPKSEATDDDMSH